jgi:transposase
MFITATKRRGRPYLQLTDSVKGKPFTVKSIGYLDLFDDGEPDYLERLRESFKSGAPLIDDLLPFVKENSNHTTICKVSNNARSKLADQPKLIADFILTPLFDQLGISELLTLYKSRSKIQYDLNGITKLLTFGRILNPVSKSETLCQNDNYFRPVAKDLKNDDDEEQLQKVYRALDVLDKISVNIQKRMNTKITNTIGRDSELTFYDVTNYYFEIENNDEDEGDKEGLRKRGYSKESRRQPLVQMGLFMDNQGLPISYKLFPGNKLDQTTLRPALAESINNFDLGRVVVVADKGLNSGLNILKLKESGNGYVFSKSVKKCTEEVRKWILDMENEKYTVVSDKFRYKSRIVNVEIKDQKGKTIDTITQKQVVKWSKKFYDRDMHENAKFLEYLENCVEHPDKLKDKQSKTQKFLKKVVKDKKGNIIKAKSVLEVDTKKLQKYKDMMGYYLICTSELDRDEDWIMSKYHELSRIEDSFRVIKSDLEGRPVYVSKPEHINAHFLICFLSLTMIRILQRLVSDNKVDGENGWKVGITADKLKRGLNMLTTTVQCDLHYAVHKPGVDIMNLLSKLGVNDLPELPTYSDVVGLKNTLAKVNMFTSKKIS